MRAFRLTSPGEAAVTDVQAPGPGAGDVLLRVLAAGVCRTDLDLLRAGASAMPVTLGHEIVGEVVELGPDVTGVSVGAPVAVYELIGCGACAPCVRGEANLCRTGPPAVPGVTRDGGMAEHVVVPARNLVAVGAVDPLEAAPLTDAGMTALHAVERARPWLTAEATVVIVGIGGLGHLGVQFVAATSPARVVAVDVDETRLALAKELGAAASVRSGAGAADGVIAAAGGRVDVVLDFVGSQASLDLAARVTARGGAIVVTGGGGGRLCLTAAMGAGRVPDREVTIVHTFGGARSDLERALALAAAGRVRTRVEAFALEDAARALAELGAGRILGRAVVIP